MLIHFFVVSRLDYCSALCVGFPATRVGCLVRVLRSAARYIGCIPRFRHVTDYMRDVLHWLPFPQWIAYRISSLVWRWCGLCLSTGAPPSASSTVVLLALLGRLRFLSPGRGLLFCSAVLFLLLACNLEWASFGTTPNAESPSDHVLF